VISCPDCSAASDRVLVHDNPCPVLIGVRQVCIDDEKWFSEHPFAKWRWRDMQPAERAEIEMTARSLDGLFCRVLVADEGHGEHSRAIWGNGELLLVVHDLPPVQGWAA